jgi:hypothetical protein
MSPDGYDLSGDANNSTGTKAISGKKSKCTKDSSGNIKRQLMRPQLRRRKVSKELPLLDKSLPKKKRLQQAKSPNVNAATSPNQLKSPDVDYADIKTESKKKRISQANSLKVDAATSDNQQRSPVVESVDPALPLDQGKTSSTISSASTGFNCELHALLQQVYAKVLLERELTLGTVNPEQSSVPTTENTTGDQNNIGSFSDLVNMSQHKCGYSYIL